MIAKFTKKCLTAIQKLHLHGSSHGNLTANNIFVTKNFDKVKITDYANINSILDNIAVVHEMTFVWTNFKKIFEMCILEQKANKTKPWLGSNKFQLQVFDLFCLSCCIYQLIAKKPPNFQDDFFTDILGKRTALTHKFKCDAFANVSEELYDYLRLTLCYLPLEFFADMSLVYSHPFFKKHFKEPYSNF